MNSKTSRLKSGRFFYYLIFNGLIFATLKITKNIVLKDLSKKINGGSRRFEVWPTKFFSVLNPLIICLVFTLKTRFIYEI
jgi:hypothetical protein